MNGKEMISNSESSYLIVYTFHYNPYDSDGAKLQYTYIIPNYFMERLMQSTLTY